MNNLGLDTLPTNFEQGQISSKSTLIKFDKTFYDILLFKKVVHHYILHRMMYKSFDFEKRNFFDQRDEQVKYGWCQQVGARKLRCLSKLFFIRDVHTNLFMRFHQSTQKFIRDYTSGPGLQQLSQKNSILDVRLRSE